MAHIYRLSCSFGSGTISYDVKGETRVDSLYAGNATWGDPPFLPVETTAGVKFAIRVECIDKIERI